MAKDDITIPRLATAPKPRRKKPTKKAPKKSEYMTVNTAQYGYNQLVTDAMMSTLFGERIPGDLEGQAKFWKEKYDSASNRNSNLQAQVDLLKSIINSAMTRSCSGNS